MNVQEKVREILRRVEQEASQDPVCRDGVGQTTSEELEVFRSSCLHLSSISDSVGQMPPSPDTRRALLGGFLIGIIQRALFWYTPQIVRFQNEVAHALSSACSLLDMQHQQIGGLRREMRMLRGELLRIRRQTKRSATGSTENSPATSQDYSNGSENALLESFLSASYDKLRGARGETAQKLQIYLQVMQNFSIPDGPWLDLGCGRGEWLLTAGAAGHSILGVDSSPAAVGYCQEMGLKVAEEDVLDYLRKVVSQSVAVITAFHVIEHCDTVDLLALARECVRALKPGGILIVETPDPCNLVMASHLFWRDPSHRRPIPMSLLELIYEYFGLTVIERLRLNRPPTKERLPFDELEFVQRLNEHLYGPQDYGLIGQR